MTPAYRVAVLSHRHYVRGATRMHCSLMAGAMLDYRMTVRLLKRFSNYLGS